MTTHAPPAMPPDDGEAGSLRDYLAVLRRRWPVIALLTIAVTAGAVAFSSRQTPLYKASADVLIGQTNLAASLTGIGQAAPEVPADRYAQTQTDLAREPIVASLATHSVEGAHMSVGDLLKSSSVSAGLNSDILTFTVSMRRPATAEALASAYARAYVTFRRRLDTSALEYARRGVIAELARLRSTGQETTALGTSLAAKSHEIQTLEALQNANATVVRSDGSPAKVRPRPKLYAGFGLGAGLLLGLLVAVLFEALDTRIRSEEELTATLGLPLLGRIPALRARRFGRKRHFPLMITRPATPEAEAFRMLRSSIDLVNLRHGARSFLITSALSNEGKSTVAANLAVAFAQTGRRVTLIDFDLRVPALARIFDLPTNFGLTDLALGTIDVDAALNPVAVTGAEGDGGWAEGSLEVVAPGMLPPDPASFIEAPVVGKLLKELASRSDLVLIDSPPLLSVGDAAALFPKVDALIVVASRRILRRPMLAELKRLLDASHIVRLGIIATNTENVFTGTYEPPAASWQGRKIAKRDLATLQEPK